MTRATRARPAAAAAPAAQPKQNRRKGAKKATAAPAAPADTGPGDHQQLNAADRQTRRAALLAELIDLQQLDNDAPAADDKSKRKPVGKRGRLPDESSDPEESGDELAGVSVQRTSAQSSPCLAS
jgi:hypothetical protein